MDEKIKAIVNTLSIDDLYPLLDKDKILAFIIRMGDKNLVTEIIQRQDWSIYIENIIGIIKLLGFQRIKRSSIHIMPYVLDEYCRDKSISSICRPNINKRILKCCIRLCPRFAVHGFDNFKTACYKYNALNVLKMIYYQLTNGKRDFVISLLIHDCKIPKNVDLSHITEEILLQVAHSVINYRMIKKYFISHFKAASNKFYVIYGNIVTMNIFNPKLALLLERHKVQLEFKNDNMMSKIYYNIRKKRPMIRLKIIRNDRIISKNLTKMALYFI